MQSLLQLLASRFAKFAGLAVLLLLAFLARLFLFPKSPIIWWILGAVIVSVIWIGFIFYSQYRAKKASQEIKGNIVGSASAAEANVRPDLRESYSKIRAALQEAIENLEQSKRKGEKGSPLYRLPWLLVVGPPAGGKTTAVVNSGIRFPKKRMDEAGSVTDDWLVNNRIEGSGGTRGCNWFFSSDAIILDTAGRWTAREQGVGDEAEWLQFLDVLRKTRPRRPVNGVVALCSIEKVLSGKEEARKAARKIRAQVDELIQRLEIHVPIYLIFNKCDLIHGFAEYFQDLSEESRKQPWGYTRKYQPRLLKSKTGLASEVHSILESFDSEFDSLSSVLEERRMHRLADPQVFPNERAALCIFPSEFHELKEPVRAFIETMFEDNPFGHNPLLRGVYFSSATQREGSPIVQLMQRIAGDYDIPLEAMPFSRRQTFDSYFLHDLMHNVVFPDHRLAGRFKRSILDRTRIGLAIGLGVATVLIGLLMFASYLGNSNANERLKDAAERVQSVSFQTDGAPGSLMALDSLRYQLSEYANRGAFYRLFNRILGVSEGGDLSLKGQEMLAAKTREIFAESAWNKARGIIEHGVGDLQEIITAYKVYLLLSEQPEAKDIDASELTKLIMASFFVRETDPGKSENYRRTLNSLLEYYSQRRPSGIYLAEQRVIDAGKGTINARWSWETYFQGLLSSSADSASGFSANLFTVLTSSTTVPRAYQATGWVEYVRDSLDRAYNNVFEDKVLLSALGSKVPQKGDNPLIREYVAECKRRWLTFFQGVRFAAPSGGTEALVEKLGQAGSISSYITRSYELTSFPGREELNDYFVSLKRFVEPPTPPAGGQPLPAPQEKYAASLSTLLNAVVEFAPSSSGGCVEGYRQAAQKISLAQSSAGLPSGGNEFAIALNKALTSPFDAARANAAGNVQSCLSEGWKANVYDYFHEKLAAQYPFAKGTSNEASGDAVRDFFSEAGPVLDFDSRMMKPAKSAGFSVSESYASAVGKARAISRTLSGQSSDALTLEFHVRYSVSKEISHLTVYSSQTKLGELFMGGQPERVKLPLPFDNGPLVVGVELSGGNVATPITIDGPWAPLKLLDMAERQGQIYVLTFQGGAGGRFTLGFKIVNGDDAISSFNSFRSQLPARITP